MNSLYHIAILEGYLSQHPDLPRNVQDAISHFKQQATLAPLAINDPNKKKRKLTPEQREKMLQHVAKMREIKIAKGSMVNWDDAKKQQVRDLLREGRTGQQIGQVIGLTDKAVYSAIARYDLR